MVKKYFSLIVVVLLAMPPQAWSAYTYSPPPLILSNRSESCFAEEAIVDPVVNLQQSFTHKTAELWEQIAAFFSPVRLWQPAGIHEAMPMASLDTSSSGEPRGRPSGDPLKEDVKRQMFNRHDGIDFISPVAALKRFGILDLLKMKGSITSENLVGQLHQWGRTPNSGYWEVAMQVMASQGWITREGDAAGAMTFRLTPLGYAATEKGFIDAYLKADQLIHTDLGTVDQLNNFLVSASPRGPPHEHFTFPEAVALSARQWDLPPETAANREIRQRVLAHLDGLLVGMAGFTLADRNVLQIKFEGDERSVQLPKEVTTLQDARRVMRRSLFERWQWVRAAWRALVGDEVINEEYLQAALTLLKQQGWLISSGDGYTLTAKGTIAAQSIKASGVPISYLPMFAQIDELLNGTPSKVFERKNGQEMHVARRINVIGSGAAHHSYFKEIVKMLDATFNQPLENQPQFIEDMGCGDGTYLVAMYDYILKNTARGKAIRSNPKKYKLLMIGADFNKESRDETKKTLSENPIKIDGILYPIPNAVVYADINDPDGLAQKIQGELGLDPKNGMHTSTFLMHNRPFLDPEMWEEKSRDRGAYTSYYPQYKESGHAISTRALDRNLLEFFKKWYPYLERFGMMTVELHSTPDDVAEIGIGTFSGTSYIATHGFSGQYIVPVPHFIAIAEEAGLEVVQKILKPGSLVGGHAPTSLLMLRAKKNIGNVNSVVPNPMAATEQALPPAPWLLRHDGIWGFVRRFPFVARWFAGTLSPREILDYFDRQESESLRNSKGTLEEIRLWDRKRFGGFDAELLLSAAERDNDDAAVEKLLRHLEEVAPIGNAGLLRRIRTVGNRSESEPVRRASASAYLRLARNEIQATTGRVFTLSLTTGAELNKAIQQHAWDSGYAAAMIEMKEPFEMSSVNYAAYSIEEQQYIDYVAQRKGNDVVIERITASKPGMPAFTPIVYANARLDAMDVRGNLSEWVDDSELIGEMNQYPTGTHQGLFAHTHIHFKIRSAADRTRVLDERMGRLDELSAVYGSVRITELTGVRLMRDKDLVSPSDPIKIVSRPNNLPTPKGPTRLDNLSERGFVRRFEEPSPPSHIAYFLRLDNHDGIGDRLLELMKKHGIKEASLSGIGAMFGARFENRQQPNKNFDIKTQHAYLASGSGNSNFGPFGIGVDFTAGDDLGRVREGEVTGHDQDNANAWLGEFVILGNSNYATMPARSLFSIILILMAMPLTMLHGLFSKKMPLQSNPTFVSA